MGAIKPTIILIISQIVLLTFISGEILESNFLESNEPIKLNSPVALAAPNDNVQPRNGGPPLSKNKMKNAIDKAYKRMKENENADEVHYKSQFIGKEYENYPLNSYAALMKPKPEAVALSRSAKLEMETIKLVVEDDEDVIADSAVNTLTSTEKVSSESVAQALPPTDVNATLVAGEKIISTCFPKPLPCDATYPYRFSHGWCNNLKNPGYATSFAPMLHLVPVAYENGIDIPRQLSVTGKKLPIPRRVSNAISEDDSTANNKYSHMVMQFGQFLDHDITHVATETGPNGTNIDCSICDADTTVNRNCIPIEIPNNDPHFPAFKENGQKRCLPFARSLLADTSKGYRNQVGQLTPYVDGSVVYGSTPCETDGLRLFKGGLLRFSDLGEVNHEALPTRDDDSSCRSRPQYSCFKAGDFRNTHIPGITVLHNVMLREHNRIARTFSAINTNWSDEKLFQETRKVIGAMMQHIVYSDYLPILVGQANMDKYKLTVQPTGYFKGYDATCEAAISHPFATAAFRFGHSLVRPNYKRLDSFFRNYSSDIEVKDNFDNAEPQYNLKAGGMDSILAGLLGANAMDFDRFVTNHLRNLLFAQKGQPLSGFDLIAINIQRARDHGVAGYNKFRVYCGFKKLTKWEDLNADMDQLTIQRMRSVYDSVEDIDLFPGLMSEKPIPGALLSPTAACIISEQFGRIKKCDRFWYENDQANTKFTEAQLNEIRKTDFSRIFCDNSKILTKVQRNVFLMSDSQTNPHVPCNDLPRVDLSKWSEKDKKPYEDFVIQITEKEGTMLYEFENSKVIGKEVFKGIVSAHKYLELDLEKVKTGTVKAKPVILDDGYGHHGHSHSGAHGHSHESNKENNQPLDDKAVVKDNHSHSDGETHSGHGHSHGGNSDGHSHEETAHNHGTRTVEAPMAETLSMPSMNNEIPNANLGSIAQENIVFQKMPETPTPVQNVPEVANTAPIETNIISEKIDPINIDISEAERLFIEQNELLAKKTLEEKKSDEQINAEYELKLKSAPLVQDNLIETNDIKVVVQDITAAPSIPNELEIIITTPAPIQKDFIPIEEKVESQVIMETSEIITPVEIEKVQVPIMIDNTLKVDDVIPAHQIETSTPPVQSEVNIPVQQNEVTPHPIEVTPQPIEVVKTPQPDVVVQTPQPIEVHIPLQPIDITITAQPIGNAIPKQTIENAVPVQPNENVISPHPIEVVVPPQPLYATIAPQTENVKEEKIEAPSFSGFGNLNTLEKQIPNAPTTVSTPLENDQRRIPTKRLPRLNTFDLLQDHKVASSVDEVTTPTPSIEIPVISETVPLNELDEGYCLKHECPKNVQQNETIEENHFLQAYLGYYIKQSLTSLKNILPSPLSFINETNLFLIMITIIAFTFHFTNKFLFSDTGCTERFQRQYLHDALTKIKEQGKELEKFKGIQDGVNEQNEKMANFNILEREYQKVVAQLQNVEAANLKYCSDIREKENVLNECMSENNILKNNNKEMVGKASINEAKIESMESELTKLKKIKENLEKTQTIIQESLKNTEKKLSELNVQFKISQKERNDYEKLVDSLKSSLQSITEEHDKLNREFSTLSEMFETINQNGGIKSEGAESGGSGGWSDVEEAEIDIVSATSSLNTVVRTSRKSPESKVGSVIEIARIKTEAAKLENDVKVIREQLEKEIAAKNNLQTTITSIENQLLETKAELSLKNNERSDNHSNIATLINTVNVRDGKITTLESACEKLREELSILTNKYHEVSIEKNKTENKLDEIEKEKKDLKEKLEKLKTIQFQEMNKLQKNIKTIEGLKNLEIDDLKSKLYTAEAINAANKVKKLPKPLKLTLYSPVNNYDMQKGKRIMENELLGPESLIIEGNTIYTGTHDGRVLKIVDRRIVDEIKFIDSTPSKDLYETEPLCGRPLGLRRLNSKVILVADAYLGLYKVDFSRNVLKNGFELIVSADKLTPQNCAKFLNDLDVIGDYVYVSDSSTKWERRRFFHVFMEAESSGRLLQINLKTKEVIELNHRFFFPNGVQAISDTELLVAETGMARIWKVYVAGEKKGTKEIFIENLPGLPDNIRLSKYSGNILVGLAGIRDSERRNMYDDLGEQPHIRKIILSILPDRWVTKIPYIFKGKGTIVVEINLSGKIAKAYHDLNSETFNDISHVADDERNLYLGSPHNNYIGVVSKE
uniref:Str_synth domain-containing protein n=1 Tax=Rhabditophanes sp. KR3021 TaxID=114890 RepID=A0AC35U5Q5_9BILA